MKPNFALGLTDDGVTLWHRDATGWLRVGAVALDTPNLDAQMRDLSRIAAALAPEGVTTKLVIPDDQILYCDLPVKSTAPDAQEKEIRAQLAGRTPYPVEELVFDWSLNSNRDMAQAVVVARETILEAEDFASQHGLNPISAVAAATTQKTPREPFFGATRSARKSIPNIAQIERDAKPVIETGHVTLPAPEMVPPKPTQNDKTQPTPPAAEPKKAAATVAATVVDKPEQTAATGSGAKAAATAVSASADKPGKPQTVAPAIQTGTRPGAERKSYTSSQAAADRKTALLAKLSAAKPASLAPAKILADTKQGLSQILNGKKSRIDTAPPPPAAAPEAATSPAADVASFRSRRGENAAEPTASGKGKGQPRDLSDMLRNKARSAKAALTSAMGRSTEKPVSGSSPAPTSAAKASATAAVTSTAWVSPLAKTGKPSHAKATSAAKQDSKSAIGASLAQTTRKGPIETLHAHGTKDRSQPSEAERLTIFGARNNPDATTSGSSRALLVLGGVGLLLVAAAIWAAYFITTQPSGTELAENPAQSLALEPEITTPAEPATALDDIEAALGVEDAAQQVPLDAPEVAAPADGIAEQEQQALPETTMGTPEAQAGRIAGLRSVALLPPQEAAPLPAAPSAPAPFGSEPLPPLREALEQATTPEAATETESVATSTLPAGEDLLEIAISEGAPAAVPPARPEGLAPEIEAPAEVETAPEPEAAAAPPSVVEAPDESTLEISVTQGSPASTPPARPEGIAPQQEAPEQADETNAAPALVPGSTPEQDPDTDVASDDAAAPALGAIALTALRPAARPEELITDPADIEAAQIASFENASDLAVSASLRPGSRPSQFSTIVQRSLRAAQPAAATPQTQPQQSEPIQTARAAVPSAPAIPSSASVSREATHARAINLREINLLGVMGTSSSRRALVRLSNGRVVTVRVGESLDGGQVTAIGDEELRYTRRGRNVVLRIAS